MKKWIVRIVAGLTLIAIVLAGLYFWQMRKMGFFRSPVYETVAPAVPELNHPAVLVFSKTNGFVHVDAIPAAQAMLQEIAQKKGWSIYFTNNGAIHNAHDLAKFDVVVWNNVSGNVLNVEQRQALQQYLEKGGGFVGLHATGGDFKYDWRWQPQTLICAQFIGHPLHPQFQTATVRIDDISDPIVADLGSAWSREDEWYSFEQSPRAHVHVLASLDENTYSPDMFGKSIRMGSDHPIIWKHCVGNGRVFYSAMGHTAATYSDPKYQSVIQHAMQWAGGFEGSQCSDGREVDPAQ